MAITEIIKQRRSVRNYTGKALSEADAKKIVKFIAELQAPFSGKYRIEWLHATPSEEPVRMGTYGMISGASDFLVLIYEYDKDMAEENAAYCFERVILYCTSLGLGTCWMSGTFKKSDFAAKVHLQPGETLRAVSPVGYIKEEKRWIESLIGAERNHRSRKPFSATFFEDYFDKKLTEANAGIFFEPFEMIRLAPSANNRQPWRIILSREMVHFYYRPARRGDCSRIDLGIAICHFDLTCQERGIKGHFKVLRNVKGIPSASNNVYSISWVHDIDLPFQRFEDFKKQSKFL
jgi:nitroreductase